MFHTRFRHLRGINQSIQLNQLGAIKSTVLGWNVHMQTFTSLRSSRLDTVGVTCKQQPKSQVRANEATLRGAPLRSDWREALVFLRTNGNVEGCLDSYRPIALGQTNMMISLCPVLRKFTAILVRYGIVNKSHQLVAQPVAKNGQVVLTECEAQLSPLVALHIHRGGGTQCRCTPTDHDVASLGTSARAAT